MPVYSYIDENEQLRGPFEGVQMHYWYLKGYLPPTLHIFVHHGLYGRSTTLEELRRRNGDLNPFFEVVNWRRGDSCEPLSSYSNSHSSLSYGLENVRKRRGDIKFSANFLMISVDLAIVARESDEQFYCYLCDMTMPRALMFEHCTTKEHSGKCVVEALDVLEEMRLYNESDERGDGSDGAFSHWNMESWTRTLKSVRTMDDNVLEESEKRKEEFDKRKYLPRRHSSSKTGKPNYDYRKDCALM